MACHSIYGRAADASEKAEGGSDAWSEGEGKERIGGSWREMGDDVGFGGGFEKCTITDH